MDVDKLTKEEIKSFNLSRLKEAEAEIRRSMVMHRMQILSDDKSRTARPRVLRRNLARILTYRQQSQKN